MCNRRLWRRWLIGLALLATTGAGVIHADDVRYYQENGITYREVRRKVSHPVVDTQLQAQQRVCYCPKTTVETRDVVQSHWVPVTEYRQESKLVGRWNPFVQPYYAQRSVPVTRWELRSETVKLPVSRVEYVPQTTTVQVPVTAQRVVEEEIISRMAVSGPPASPSVQPTTSVAVLPGTSLQSPATAGVTPVVAQTPSIGGTKLPQDPPRMGTKNDWQPADKLR